MLSVLKCKCWRCETSENLLGNLYTVKRTKMAQADSSVREQTEFADLGGEEIASELTTLGDEFRRLLDPEVTKDSVISVIIIL